MQTEQFLIGLLLRKLDGHVDLLWITIRNGATLLLSFSIIWSSPNGLIPSSYSWVQMPTEWIFSSFILCKSTSWKQNIYFFPFLLFRIQDFRLSPFAMKDTFTASYLHSPAMCAHSRQQRQLARKCGSESPVAMAE